MLVLAKEPASNYSSEIYLTLQNFLTVTYAVVIFAFQNYTDRADIPRTHAVSARLLPSIGLLKMMTWLDDILYIA